MRPADFDLAAALARKGFTPAQRDAPALVALIARGDEPAATRAAPALAGLGADARAAIATGRAAIADDGAHARLVAVLGLLARAGDDDARAQLIAQLGDGALAARVRRAAAVALGKLGTDDARVALLARWDAGDATPDERRALAEALGKVGGADARARLAALDSGADAELARRRDRALLMTDRAARRDDTSEVRSDLAPPTPLTVRLHCRSGLAGLLRAELDALGMTSMRPELHDDAAVDVALTGPWSQLFAARLWATAGVRVPLARGDDLTAAIARTITAPEVRALLAAWTRGPIRWRIGFQHGHRRAVVWTLARDVAALAPELINDPQATTWDIAVDEAAGALELTPRRLVDPRFAWRVAEVPAASHPTVAAALAWVAEPRAGDRVWDPFTGSGAELIECARRGATGALHGSDLSPDALAAATANLAAAGLTATLALADARTHAPGPVELIVSNPPLGGRLRGDAAALLGTALPNLAAQLARGGRLVWITPAPRRTGPIALAAGLTLARSYVVDLGGMRGHLERWQR